MRESVPPRQRPDLVTVIVCLGGIGTIIVIGFLFLNLPAGQQGIKGATPVLDVAIMLLALIVRGMGLLRLFFLKSDAWLLLLMAAVIALAETVMNLIEHSLEHGAAKPLPIVTTLLGFALSAAIIIYAYKICRDPEERSNP